MIPSPSSHMPPGGMYNSNSANKLSYQMQDLTLGPPLPQVPTGNPPSQNARSGEPSPQHHKPPSQTSVTYSAQPGSTYPYGNNNSTPGASSNNMQRPPINNNQYPNNSPYSGQPAAHPQQQVQKQTQHQIGSPVHSFPTNAQRFSNGMSNGHDSTSPNVGSPRHSQPQSFNQPTSPGAPPQSPMQYPSTPGHHVGSPPNSAYPPQPYQSSQMSQKHGQMSNLPPTSPQMSQNLGGQMSGNSNMPPNSPHMNQNLGQMGNLPPGPQMGQPPQPGPHMNQNLGQMSNLPPGPQMGQPPKPGQHMNQNLGQMGNLPPGPQMGQPPQPGLHMNQNLGQMGNLPPGPQMGQPSQPGFQPYTHGSPPSNFPPHMAPSPGMQPHIAQGQQWGSGPPNSYPYGAPNQGPIQQQPRKLELDQMPNTVQVRDEDRKTRSGVYTTDVKSVLPPLVTTDFVVQDRGMCSPRFIRSSLYILPNDPGVLKQTAVPFAITINPLASLCEGETSPPTCLYRKDGPLRCKRCKAYICPFMTFMEGGRCFQCAFCKVVTEVPEDYFCFLDGMGERTDKYHRPELCLGSYEYIATKEYCRNDELPNPPAYIFMIEVSSGTFRNGLIQLLCENMKNVLHCLRSDERNDNSKLKVGFVTYNNVLHFYNMKKNLSQPHIMVLSDVHNAFVPLLEGFLVTLDEAEALVDSLMEQIPRQFMNEPATEIILGPVIQVGLEALKNANCSGKLLVFHSTIPNADAPGKLPHREGQKLLGTEKQKIPLAPQTDFYSKLAQDCVAAGCAVDLFLFPNSYIDIASLSPLCKYTGGQVYKYTYFQAHIDGDRFLEDLERNVTTTTAFDAVLRVRTSAGISPVFYYGNFYMSNATDIELSAIDCHKAVTVEFAYDDKLPESETVFLQAALLYTTSTGERRIRCHNLAIPTSVGMPDVFKCCELDMTINFLAKQALKQLLDHSPQQMKNALMSRCVKMLACYRKHCATSSSQGQLILPDSMKLLPLYLNCLLKSDALNGGSDMSLDDRSFAMIAVNSMDVKSTVTHFYPTLLPLHELDPSSEGMPAPIRCSIEKLSDNGAYLLENGIYMFLWVGQAISPEWLQNVLGVQSTNLIDKQKSALPELNTPLSQKIRQMIEDLQEGRQWYMRLSMMVQGDQLEIVFRQFLVEDRAADGGSSYVDFLCHLHREISKNP